MSAVRKYANLPDLDNAPDIYETPSLASDISTVQTSARSPSPASSASDSESGISRQRLRPDQARSQFRPNRVDARDADFSERIGEKRRSYAVSRRGRRRAGTVIEGDGEDDLEEEGGWSSGDEEGLERKLARLRREVEEVRAEFARRKQEEAEGKHGEEGDNEGMEGVDGVKELSDALKTIRASSATADAAHSRLSSRLSRPHKPSTTPAPTSAPTPEIAETAPSTDAQTLTHIASFDTRLASLEKALGLASLEPTTTFTPILPTLQTLDSQLSLLTSPSQLDALAQRMQNLPAPRMMPTTNGTPNGASTPAEGSMTLPSEDLAKLHSLYSLLPTLTSLSPTLPPLLARLRSLHLLHSSAAAANQTLDDVERRQGEMEAEIKAWNAGLEKVEAAVSGAEEGMKGNVRVVESWVKELEGRMEKL